MISVKSVTIKKFRAFHPGECFELGKGVTLIAGLNGTAKSTLLGMICQPIGFPTTDKKSIYTDAYKDVSLRERRTLFGTPFKSAISDVFRFSKVHDKPRQHDYVVKLNADPGLLSNEIVGKGLSVRSEARGGAENDKIRIVTNSDIRDPGAGNFPHPVIYLGLDRLRPLSTVDTVNMNTVSQLSEDEKAIWNSFYSEVMLSAPSEHISSGLLDAEKGGKRKYESVNASNYDGESASAGQDNLSQLITAIISFHHLKKELGDNYQGGVLLIDELDATLHPFSQVALLQRLIKYADALKIQIVATTHSMFLLKLASRDFKKATRLLFLDKRDDGQVYLLNDVSYEEIEYKLSLVREKRKIKHAKFSDNVVTLFEDEVGAMFFKSVTKNIFKDCLTIYSTEGENNETALSNNILASIARYIASKKIPQFAEVVYIMDGDSRNLLNKKAKNLLCLPGAFCAEREIYDMLHADDAFAKKCLKALGVSRQDCFNGFNDIALDPLLKSDQAKKAKYKEWFSTRRSRGVWGRSCAKVFNLWRSAHVKDCREFCVCLIVALQSIRGDVFAKTSEELLKKIKSEFSE